MRKLLLGFCLTVMFVGICSIFWYQEWKYNLPTPVPSNYKEVKPGTPVNLAGKIPAANSKPLFIHFFNPDCPCSRFNIPHFKTLLKKYGDELNFVVVVINKTSHYTAAEIKDKYDLNVPVVTDTTIAALCGVYSTPQAVIIGADQKLYYRGNYNRSRYCTDKNSDFAQMAIDSLLNNTAKPVFNQLALKAYGCQVGYCPK